jgi:hypothetical protein
VNPRASSTSFIAALATVLTALGVCAVAASIMVPALLPGVNDWALAAAGSVALTGGLMALWRLLKV